MWNRLTHLVKHRGADAEGDGHDNDPNRASDVSNASATTNGSVMSRVYEQHPNLSVFHPGSAVNLASPSPPASPTKGSKRSIFKRSLKAKLTSTPLPQGSNPSQEDMLSPASSVWTSPSPAKLIPKKFRASLQVDTFTAQSSKTAPEVPTAPESAPLPVQPHTPIFAEQHRNSAPNHISEMQPAGTGSIRSILRDPNTPGTGQSVRFFSRDAYRVISPNVSELEIEEYAIPGMDPETFLEKLRSVSPENTTTESSANATKYHSAPTSPPDNVVDMFSPPRQGPSAKSRKPLPFQPRHPPRPRNMSAGSHSSHSRSDSGSISASNSQSLSSLLMPIPPADMSNLFDISNDELVEIPVSVEGSLLENAIEEVENESEAEEKLSSISGDVSMTTIGRSGGERAPFPSNSTPNRSRSVALPRAILSPEGTVFHSAAGSMTTEGNTIFHSFGGASDERTSATMFFTPDASNAKFANKTAFFTPNGAPSTESATDVTNGLIPAPPPAPSQDVIHSQEDLVTSLREQLTLQQQLAAQYEVDLSARDELVSVLSTQLQTAEAGAEKYRKEVERRQSAMRGLRRKVGELEKICRGLEEEVERSREESFERSVMDEASEGALVVLQGSIGQLKGELERVKEDETKAREECDSLRSQVEAFTGERERHNQVESDLRTAMESQSKAVKDLESRLIAAAQGDSYKETIEELQSELVQKAQALEQERERHRLAEFVWAEERSDLTTRLDARVSNQDTREAHLERFKRKFDEKEEEVKVLKAEVEAQWGHAEKADERIKGLEGEKEALAKSVQSLHSKVEELGSEWKEGEVKRAELEDELNEAWAVKEEVEHERDQLVEDVNFEREHAEQLTRSLQERESKLDEQEQERRYAMDNIARLEELLRKRDAESADAQRRIVEREQEAEQLRADMNKVKREHGRLVDEQGRHLGEITQREDASRREMESLVRQKAEGDVALRSMKERLGILTEEVGRLRRQVHDLQQESADKEVKLLQLTKVRVQDKEDKEGLNIALDSKQQELELLKRKLGLKGTGGSTPAPNRTALPDLASRRQSVAFATPSAPRPRPSSVVGLTKVTPAGETPGKTSLGTSLRGNSASSSAAPPSAMKSSRSGSVGSMGPPPPKRSTANVAALSASTSSLVRSTASSKSRSALPISSHRRSSSVISTRSDDGEKENATPAKTPRRTMVLA